MSVLSDSSINRAIHQGLIGISPYNRSRIQPASYDVSLGYEVRLLSKNGLVIDTRNIPSDLTELQSLESTGSMLEPQEFVLASTFERFELSDKVVARIEGKSSLGRLGLAVHSTAGWIDPGFRGHITLELFNHSPSSIVLYPMMVIAQIAFMWTDTRVKRPYGSPGLGSRYQDSVGTIESRYQDDG